jgi:hypothetical protein
MVSEFHDYQPIFADIKQYQKIFAQKKSISA